MHIKSHVRIANRNVDILRRRQFVGVMELHAGTFRAARSLLDLTQAEVARHAEVSRSLVLRVEAGGMKRTLHPDTIKLIRFYESHGIEFLKASEGDGPGLRWNMTMGDGVVPRAYLRAARALAGINQATLAQRAGVGQSLISRFESGDTKSIATTAFEGIVAGLRTAGAELIQSEGGKAGVYLRVVQ